MEIIFPMFVFVLGFLTIFIGLAMSATAKSRTARYFGRGICIPGAMLLALLAYGCYGIFVNEELVQAVSRGSVEDVKAMLSLGASPNATIEQSPPAIEIAKRNGYDAIVKILREAGAKE